MAGYCSSSKFSTNQGCTSVMTNDFAFVQQSFKASMQMPRGSCPLSYAAEQLGTATALSISQYFLSN